MIDRFLKILRLLTYRPMSSLKDMHGRKTELFISRPCVECFIIKVSLFRIQEKSSLLMKKIKIDSVI